MTPVSSKTNLQTPGSTSTYTQSYYNLADFTGCDLKIVNGRIEGEGKVKVDLGLHTATFSVKVFSSKYDPVSFNCALLLATPVDLGILILYNAAKQDVDLLVLDRRKLEKRGSGLLEDLKDPVQAIDAVLDATVAEFFGSVKGPFQAYTEDQVAE